MAEGARLESVCASNGTAGSNPALSARREGLRPFGLGLSLLEKGLESEGFGGVKSRTGACTEHD